MKKEIDKYGRTLYKFSHSVLQGGEVYIHKTAHGSIIQNKLGVRNALSAIAKKYDLIDPTIKVYDNIILFFHLARSVSPAELIDSIQKNISSFAEWDKEYIYQGVYDLQEKFVRKDLEKLGFDYDKG